MEVTGENDPGEVVADEFAGQALTFAFAGAILQDHIAATALLGFVLFRIFDIIKPWPAGRLEKLPAGWGILADDLMAGVYAAVLLIVAVKTGLVQSLSQWLHFDVGSLGISSAAFLGMVQGLTEFLPVSSSGHLVLLEKVLDFNPEDPQMLLFDLSVHFGTVIAILVVFRKSAAAFFKNLIAFRKHAPRGVKTIFEVYRRNPAVHLLVLAICATAVTGSCGLVLKEYFLRARGSLVLVACMWVVTGTLLVITDLRGKTHLGLRQFLVWHAIVVGLVQAAAILPGISRSGATICVAILLGLRRRWAVEFSLLLAVPAILGATVLEFIWESGQAGIGDLPIAPLIVGAVTAAVTGTIALKVLIKAARSANLKVFGWYCYALAGIVLIWVLR
jgi:undecaprenyl-diphosphatase